MKVLLDHNLPRKLRLQFKGHLAFTARQMRWDALDDGSLLRFAELANFDVLLTADQGMISQQNNAQRRISLVLMTNPHLENILPVIETVLAAVGRALPGSFERVEVPRPSNRRKN